MQIIEDRFTVNAETPVLYVNPRGFSNEWDAMPVLPGYMGWARSFADRLNTRAEREGASGAEAYIRAMGECPKSVRARVAGYSGEKVVVLENALDELLQAEIEEGRR